jgi:hypothetical protein
MNAASPHHHDIANEAELLEAIGGTSLRLRFTGPFGGRTVTWDATIHALGASAGADNNASRRNFIDIGDESAAGVTLTVGLNVTAIDLPTVRKTILMIRQYKRLSHGRREYGSATP